MEIIEKTPAREFVDAQRARINRSANARKWFVRGVVTTLVGLAVYAKMTEDNKDEAN